MSCCLSCPCCFAGTSGPRQKKGISPDHMTKEIKHVKDALCVVSCLFAPNVQNAPSVANSLTVGGRLQKFWQVWEKLGSNPMVVSILKEGYMLPFKMRPPSQGHKWLCKPGQEPVPKRGINCSDAKVGSR